MTAFAAFGVSGSLGKARVSTPKTLTPLLSRRMGDLGKRALYVHGSLYAHPYIFGSTRGRSGEPCATIVRARYDDYTNYDGVTINNANFAGGILNSINAIAYARGKIWFAVEDNIGPGGIYPAISLYAVDAATLAVTLFQYKKATDGGVAPYIAPTVGGGIIQANSEAIVSDGNKYVYFSASGHSILRLDLDTMAFSLVDLTAYVTNTTSWHSAAIDGTHVYFSAGTGDTGTGAGLDHYLVKVQLSDFTYVSRALIPKATDDMAISTNFVHCGYEANLRTAMFGYGVGAIAVRKSDMAVFYLPSLGPEDDAIYASYASLVFSHYLLEVKVNGHLYVVDLDSDPAKWNTGMTDLTNIVVLDGAWNLTATTLYRNPGYGSFTPAGDSKIPNELVADNEGRIHMFCWPRGNPFVADSETTNDLSSGLIRGLVPGIQLVGPPTVTTILANHTATSDTLRGNLLDLGGLAITEAGFYLDTFSPPSTKVVVSGVTGLGTYDHIPSGLTSGTAYYFRAFATNASGTGVGDILTFTPTSLRGFKGVVRRNGVADVGATVLVVDATTKQVVAQQDVGGDGVYRFLLANYPSMIEGRQYHLFSVRFASPNKYRSVVKAYQDIQTVT